MSKNTSANSGKPGRLKSYAPYSGIQETCYVAGKSGLFYPGVRVENISYPLTLSAAQNAVCSCLANDDIPQVLYQSPPESELLGIWTNIFGLEVQSELPGQFSVFSPFIRVPAKIQKTLEKLSGQAVVPNSDFPVSALLKISSGYIWGVNVEIKDHWSLGLCAERVAITRAVAAGYTEFHELSIFAPKGEYCSPCGTCRQVITEFSPGYKIHLFHGDQTTSAHNAGHLLPFAFTAQSLAKEANPRKNS